MTDPIFATPKGDLKDAWINALLGIRDLTVKNWVESSKTATKKQVAVHKKYKVQFFKGR
jgi:hypothetical protein